jgi:hypothetical protein
MWIQNTLLNDNDITSNNNHNSISASSCLLSSDLMQQLDIKPEIKTTQRLRAWTIDSTNDNIRYTANPTPSDNRFGISHSNVDLSAINHGMSPSLLPATASLLPASPALSAASVHSTNGGSGPLTPPVLGPIGGGLSSSTTTTTAAVTTTTSNTSGSVLGMLPVPIIPGPGATTLRGISGRPRSSSVGTTNSSSSVSLLAGQSIAPFHSHYNHIHPLHQPHGPSLLGTNGSTPVIDTPISAAITTTMAVAATSTAAIDSTEQRRLPVFRRFGHV